MVLFLVTRQVTQTCRKANGGTVDLHSNQAPHRSAILDRTAGATARLIVDKSEDIALDKAKPTGQGLVRLNGLTQSARAAGTLLNGASQV